MSKTPRIGMITRFEAGILVDAVLEARKAYLDLAKRISRKKAWGAAAKAMESGTALLTAERLHTVASMIEDYHDIPERADL